VCSCFLIEYKERFEGLLQKSNLPAALLLEHFQSMMCHTGKHSQSMMCHTRKHLNSTICHTGKHVQSVKCHTSKHLQLMMCHTGKHGVRRTLSGLSYGVATISRLLKIIGLFCRISLFYWALLQKRPIILRSLLIVATP